MWEYTTNKKPDGAYSVGERKIMQLKTRPKKGVAPRSVSRDEIISNIRHELLMGTRHVTNFNAYYVSGGYWFPHRKGGGAVRLTTA